MAAAKLLLSAALTLTLPASWAANPDAPHPHSGKLSPYVLGPPTVLLSREDEDELKSGEAIMRAITAPRAPLADEKREGGTRRLLMVRDVKAPKNVVLDRINDFESYPRMVKGCDGCKVYKREERNDGTTEVRCEYKIHALHMKFTYYMLHYVDKDNGCVVWNLDYNRDSDLDDSVGYWYVQPRSRDSCRVYYSCDTKLKGWVPAPVYKILSKTAVKQATIWVNNEAVAQWERMKAENKANDGPLGLGAHLREAREAMGKALPSAKRKGINPREWRERLRPPWTRPSPPTPMTLRRGLAKQVPVHC